MRTQSFMDSLNTIMEWIMRFSVTNLIWFFLNLPILYLVVKLFHSNSNDEIAAVVTTIVVLLPFIFFPATTAMFAIIRKWIMKEQDIPLIRSFWTYYKGNYVKSMIGGIILVLCWVIFFIDLYYIAVYVNYTLGYLFLIIGALLFIFTMNFISNIVHIDSKMVYLVRNAILITFVNPLINIAVFVVNIFIIYISITSTTFILPLFIGSLVAYVSFFGFYKTWNKIEMLKS